MVKSIRSKKLKKETDTETEKKKLNKAPERRDGGKACVRKPGKGIEGRSKTRNLRETR